MTFAGSPGASIAAHMNAYELSEIDAMKPDRPTAAVTTIAAKTVAHMKLDAAAVHVWKRAALSLDARSLQTRPVQMKAKKMTPAGMTAGEVMPLERCAAEVFAQTLKGC